MPVAFLVARLAGMLRARLRSLRAQLRGVRERCGACCAMSDYLRAVAGMARVV